MYAAGVRTVAILALVAACGHKDAPPKQEPVVTSNLEWSLPVDGIRIRLEAPGPTARAGDAIVMAL